MSVDERRLGELVEESEDLQSDALRNARPALDETVDLAHERGRHDLDESRRFAHESRGLISRGVMGGGALAAAGFGGALLTLMARPAFADQSMDVQMLQTAASIENLAVATYTAYDIHVVDGRSFEELASAPASIPASKGAWSSWAYAYSTVDPSWWHASFAEMPDDEKRALRESLIALIDTSVPFTLERLALVGAREAQ